MSKMFQDEPPRPFREFRRVPDPPEDPNDRYALLKVRQQRTMDYIVAVEEVKMLQEQLALCHLRARENHREDCAELRKAYQAKISSPRFGAYDPTNSKHANRVRALRCQRTKQAGGSSSRRALSRAPLAEHRGFPREAKGDRRS